MRVHFWGTRGSLPVAARADQIRAKLTAVLVAASGQRFDAAGEAGRFLDGLDDFALTGGYGGASSCVEIDGGGDAFTVCDMGSGLRDFGLSALARAKAGHPKLFNVFLSHLHWDHIMGFPFFAPAFDPEATIVIHAGHPDAEAALRRQQEEISFPVAFDWLRARIEFVHLVPGERREAGGLTVSLIEQFHSHLSYGWRFERGGKAVVYSTDSEHKAETMDAEARFEAFFAHADLVVCDTMYSLADTVSLKADWGHSSSLVAVDLCRAAGARRLALFHHEPTYSDAQIQGMHREAVQYEALTRGQGPAVEVLCAYDGLDVTI